ncbi:MAG: LON peptidase substrate-binding domain-containing protein [Gammaproteobacteria bacterium]|nr:peptidase S16 [Chromatiales bacterium]MDP7153571.1 LON peptidase substrate-binding domain-containing protein [Gammaproteobacteria bacterium]
MPTLTIETISLFPLNTVLFPGGPLPLRIFEPRYLDMVSHCMREDRPFGILLLQSDSEIVDVPIGLIGTTAQIVDWYQGSDGILGITALGIDRFQVCSCTRQDNGLFIGRVELLEVETSQHIPDEYLSMSKLIEVIINDLGRLYDNIEMHYDDATWVGWRFAEILPISLEQKQHCLEIDDALGRLKLLQPLLRSIRQEMPQ